MALAPIILNDASGGSLNLSISNVSVGRPNPPLETFYTTYSFNETLIDAAIASWYDSNKDKVSVSISGPATALSYKYRIVLQSQNFSSVSDTLVTNTTFTISGLTLGATYKLKVQAYQFANGTGEFGNSFVVENIVIAGAERAANITTTAEYVDAILRLPQNISPNINQFDLYKDSFEESQLNRNFKTSEQEFAEEMEKFSKLQDIGFKAAAQKYDNLFKKSVNKSLLNLYNQSKDPNIYTIAYKVFHEIPISIDIYNANYYSFGTTLLLDSSVEGTGEVGGIGFFVSALGNNGYFLQVDSTKRSGDIDSKRRVRLFKVINGSKKFVPDTQSIPETTIDIIVPNEPYKIDIKVKYAGDGSYADIFIYVNGFEIAVKDTSPIYPTNTVALFSSIGNIYFDYVYGFKITEDEYNSNSLYNIYAGQFSKNSLKFILGNKIFNKNDLVSGSWEQLGRMEDFGKIAREIKKIEVDFDNPSIPIAPTVGINDDAYIIGHKTDNFKSELYVMNNSGFFVPLSDGNVSLMIYGYSIYSSGNHTYEEKESNQYTKDEPIYFESSWIQEEEDIKKLASWLKNQWSKGYVVINASIFGGALLSVGDIITINYPYQGLTTSQKFLIQSVNQSFSDGGMSTNITCRSL